MIKILDLKNTNAKVITLLVALLFLGSVSTFAQSDWKLEDAQTKIKNPVQADDASLKEGKALFTTNCKTCHGDPGKNNGLPLVPKPSDMAEAAFLSANTDGAIYTKMTDGRITMPSFKAVLTETQRWQIVNYIRSFDENKKVATAITTIKKVGQAVGAPYQLSLNYNLDDNSLSAFVEGTSTDGSFAPASDIEVGFFMKRKFGNLPIGNPGGVTDSVGLIQADIPMDLPGGEEGKALAIVKLSDVDTYGDISAEAEVNVKAVEIVNLMDERSLWTVSAMAPWWLIITYFGILIGVWGALGYVVLLLLKLKKAGV